MPTRREMIALAASSLAPARAAAPAMSRLETRLFNFRPSVTAEDQRDILAKLAALSKDPGLGGFMVGRNIVTIPWPTRFEWMYMVQLDAPKASTRFSTLRDALAAQCSSAVTCDLHCRLPVRYADAADVKIRHTVMFDFKPRATAEARQRNIAAIRAMGKLPMVQRYLVEPSAGSVADPDQMQWQVTGDFASMADYTAYSQAPVHLAIRKDFTENTTRVTFLDVAL